MAIGQWKDSDKLALVLFCLAAVLAIVLFLVEKTPTTIGVMLVFILGFLVYPIIHLVTSRSGRAVASISTIAIVILFGWLVWPRKTTDAKPQVGQNSPAPPSAAPASTASSVKPEAPAEKKNQENGKSVKPDKKQEPPPPAGTKSGDTNIKGDVNQSSSGDCSPNIVGNNATVAPCTVPTPHSKLTLLDDKGNVGKAHFGDVQVNGGLPPNSDITVFQVAPGASAGEISADKVEINTIPVGPIPAPPAGSPTSFSKNDLLELRGEVQQWYASKQQSAPCPREFTSPPPAETLEQRKACDDYWLLATKEFNAGQLGNRILLICSVFKSNDCKNGSVQNLFNHLHAPDIRGFIADYSWDLQWLTEDSEGPHCTSDKAPG